MAAQQHLAEATLLTPINGFMITSVALIPQINLGGVAVVLGGAGGVTTAILSLRVASLHQPSFSRLASLRHLPRAILLDALATALPQDTLRGRETPSAAPIVRHSSVERQCTRNCVP